MKTFKYILLAAAILIPGMQSCEIEENPKFFSAVNLYETEASANTVLNGVYSAMIGNDLYASDYHHLTGMGSGLFNTNRDASLKDIAALQPFSSLNFVVDVWSKSYQVIARTNDIISHLEPSESRNGGDFDDILGQSYFIRGLMYFNLVRLYGEVPLITDVVQSDRLHFPRELISTICDTIASDLGKAALLLPETGENSPGRPARYAANMLLAQLYMWQAGNLRSTETDFWQKAWDEAIKVYGKYSLVQDFRSLWFAETGNSTPESLFEIYSNAENSLDVEKLYSPSNAHAGQTTWGRMKPNLEVYDAHVNRYPRDPRIQSTFLTEYTFFTSSTNTTTKRTYPNTTKRNDKHQSYPFIFKYYKRDIWDMSTAQTLSYVPMRYAELLLMLAEIENELNGPENAYVFVNEVLERARYVSADSLSDQPANWADMSQDEFRDSIMYEYQFELLAEGQDYFRVRRRGYDYFRIHVIEAHNNHPLYDFTVERDVMYPLDPRSMLMPISQNEINANNSISDEDQNPGY